MKEDFYVDMEANEFYKEDKFKKVKISSDFTDTMSEFLDK